MGLLLNADGVYLTEIRPADSERLIRWINDPELVRLSAPYRPVHWPGHDAWFAGLKDQSERSVLAIREAPDGPILGVVQLIDIHPIHRVAEITIRIGEETARGRDVGATAVRLALGHAWRDRGLHRVWLRVLADNVVAIRAYEKAGFLREGVMREAAFIDGAFKDVVVMGVLAPR